MARRKSDSPQKSAMRDMMSVLLEGALDEELNEELGYSKYDYRNKETDNSQNGHSKKTMRTSYGDMDIAIPRDRSVSSTRFGIPRIMQIEQRTKIWSLLLV